MRNRLLILRNTLRYVFGSKSRTRRAFRIIGYRLKTARAVFLAWLVRIGLREERIQCAVCETWKRVSEFTTRLENDGACTECVDEHLDSLGRYQGYTHDSVELGKLLILESWSMNSCEDDYMSNEGWGYCARFGQFLYYADTQGFLSFDEYATEEKAQEHFLYLYKEGWGASEFDAYISDEPNAWFDSQRHGYSLSVEGKHIGTYPRLMRARAAMRLYSIRHGYWPDLWLQSERGNISHLDY